MVVAHYDIFSKVSNFMGKKVSKGNRRVLVVEVACVIIEVDAIKDELTV